MIHADMVAYASDSVFNLAPVTLKKLVLVERTMSIQQVNAVLRGELRYDNCNLSSKCCIHVLVMT